MMGVAPPEVDAAHEGIGLRNSGGRSRRRPAPAPPLEAAPGRGAPGLRPAMGARAAELRERGRLLRLGDRAPARGGTRLRRRESVLTLRCPGRRRSPRPPPPARRVVALLVDSGQRGAGAAGRSGPGRGRGGRGLRFTAPVPATVRIAESLEPRRRPRPARRHRLVILTCSLARDGRSVSREPDRFDLARAHDPARAIPLVRRGRTAVSAFRSRRGGMELRLVVESLALRCRARCGSCGGGWPGERCFRLSPPRDRDRRRPRTRPRMSVLTLLAPLAGCRVRPGRRDLALRSARGRGLRFGELAARLRAVTSGLADAGAAAGRSSAVRAAALGGGGGVLHWPSSRAGGRAGGDPPRPRGDGVRRAPLALLAPRFVLTGPVLLALSRSTRNRRSLLRRRGIALPPLAAIPSARFVSVGRWVPGAGRTLRLAALRRARRGRSEVERART